jgi:endonuclease/exonuclease/phosphatase family metal-dependent hydrolase
MGRALDGFANLHERAWHLLISLGPDIALVQEAIPPDWIRERFQVHAEPTQVPWMSAAIVQEGLPMRAVTPTPLLSTFAWYTATTEVRLPNGTDLLVGSVHATARAAFVRQLAGLDADAIRRPSVDVPWMNDLAHHAYQQLAAGRPFVIGGDWNTSRLFDSDGSTAGREFYDQAEADGWVETHWRLHEQETQTWLRKGNRPHMLDHVFCDQGTAKHLVSSRSLVDVVSFLGLSDHAPLVVDFDPVLMAEPLPAVAEVAP